MTYLLSATGGNSWTFLILGGFFVIMMLMTILPQRKRQKQMKEMLSSLGVGNRVKTIGGFVGKIVSLNEQDDSMVINIGSDENPVNVTIARQGVYNNMDAQPQQFTNPENSDNSSNNDDKPSI